MNLRGRYNMKKVLMICYEFPPIITPGSRRYSQFVNDLPKFGWEPIILTMKNPSRFFRAYLDKSISKSKRLKVYHSLELPSIYAWKIIRRLTKVSVTSFPYCGWIPHTVYKALKIIKKEQIDLIFSTVLPFSGAFIGYILKFLTKKPLVIDFRDPLVQNFQRPLVQVNSLERIFFMQKFWDKCIKNADLITIVTKSMRQFFKQGNFAFIPNGYVDLPEIPSIDSFPKEKFVIVYTGQIYPDWTPVLDNFLLAIKEFVKTHKDLLLVFVGANHDKIIKPLINKIKLDLNSVEFRFLGHLPYETCISLTGQASANLIIRPTYLNHALSSKVFDYLHSDVPVLGVLDDTNEIAKFIQKGNLGIAAPNDPRQISAALNRLMNERHFQRNWEFLKQFDRREITKKLAQLFNKIMENYL